jgi:hypothetical protein
MIYNAYHLTQHKRVMSYEQIQLLMIENLFRNPILVILPQSILPSYNASKISKEETNNLFGLG